MKAFKFFFIILFCFLNNILAYAGSPSDIMQATVYDLHPTQATVGMASVQLKAKKLAELSTDARLDYLKTHPVPVIIGPSNEYYLIDHHHMSRALIELDRKRLFIQIIADWSAKPTSQFWQDMEKSGYAYLYDASGKKLKPQQLPRTVQDLKDDPYRSLAYFAREAGGFDKTSTPFAEFFWASYYKQLLPLKALHNWKDATKKAVKLSLAPPAANLPGYRGPMVCSKVFLN